MLFEPFNSCVILGKKLTAILLPCERGQVDYPCQYRIPLYAPSSLRMGTSKWPGGSVYLQVQWITSCILCRNAPPPPSIAQEPGSPSSLADPTGMRTMRSISESLEVVGKASLGKSGIQKEKGFLSLSWPARVLKFLFWITSEKSR